MKSKKGFTLIELLVVIAIIGILAAIVLVSLRGAPQKAKNARIQADLNQVRTQAELLYVDDNEYDSLCSGTDLASSPDELGTLAADISDNGGTVSCYALSDQYCVVSSLLGDTTEYFCVDDEGHAKVYAADACDGTSYECE